MSEIYSEPRTLRAFLVLSGGRFCFCKQILFYTIIWVTFFSIYDAIQQKVHKVGKLIFPNAIEIGRGNCQEHWNLYMITASVCSNNLGFFQNLLVATSPVIELERYRNENNEWIIRKSITWAVMNGLSWNLDMIQQMYVAIFCNFSRIFCSYCSNNRTGKIKK